MKRYLIIYHRVDYDGLFSAIIAKGAYERVGDGTVETLGYNYGDALNPGIDTLLEMYDEICMVDISFNDVSTMKKLYSSGKVILIDHHSTCLSLLKENNLENWNGLRRNGEGACSLTYQYFYPGCVIPPIIVRLSMYDVWNHSILDWNTKILPIQYALRTEYGMSLQALLNNKEYIFGKDAVKDFEEEGMMILKYLNKTWRGWVGAYSFDVCVAGKFKGICMLTPQFGSQPFESSDIYNDYQVFVCANKKKKITEDGTVRYSYSVSFYSTPDKIGDFNLGDYAKSISQTGNGGGHAGAAGVELTEEQFIRLITIGDI